MFERTRKIVFAFALAAGATACFAGADDAASTVELQRQPLDVAARWLDEISNAASANDLPGLLDVLTRYDEAYDEATKEMLASVSGNKLLSTAYVMLKRADLLQDLGRGTEAAALYDAVAKRSDHPYPATWLAFRRVLSLHGLDNNIGVRDADATLVADLQAIERDLPADEFSADLSYHIAVASFVAGVPDVDRLAKLADEVSLAPSAENQDNVHTNGTVLSLAIAALVQADRREDAERMMAKLRALDDLYGTEYSARGIGQRVLAGATR